MSVIVLQCRNVVEIGNTGLTEERTIMIFLHELFKLRIAVGLLSDAAESIVNLIGASVALIMLTIAA